MLPIVPSQKASMSSRATPALCRASCDEALGRHLVDRLAVDAHARRRQVARTASVAPAPDKRELPGVGAAGRRCDGRRRVGPPRWLPAKLAPPGEERGVGETRLAGSDL